VQRTNKGCVSKHKANIHALFRRVARYHLARDSLWTPISGPLCGAPFRLTLTFAKAYSSFANSD
jgi:hypothetical protein